MKGLECQTEGFGLRPNINGEPEKVFGQKMG